MWCIDCGSNVRTTSKHCGTCNRCVDGFDHHCKWLNNCVGVANYKFFIGLLASSAALIFFKAMIMVQLFR